MDNTSFGSCVFANKPGDGSAREQAASCQKVLGGDANICYEYATKRYRSNCINWGIVPFTISKDTEFQYEVGDMVFVPGIRQAILDGKEEIDAHPPALPEPHRGRAYHPGRWLPDQLLQGAQQVKQKYVCLATGGAGP